MRILVCGSRDWPSGNQIIGRFLDGFKDLNPTIIQGEARGADIQARQWAETNDMECISFPANWKIEGKRAGYIRNQRMLDEGKPDLVLAFVSKPLPESRGTAMMVEIARSAGKRVYVIERHFTPLPPPPRRTGI